MNVEIEYVEKFKSLGVFFSSTMKRNVPIEYLKNKLARVGGIRGKPKYLPAEVNLIL